MKNIKALAIMNALFFLLHVCLSYFTQFKLVNSLSVGEISDRHETMFTPADSTFVIWGVIYTALAVFCLYHVVIAFKHEKFRSSNVDLSRIGNLFILNNIAAAAWLLAWTNELLLISVILIVFQLGTLIAIHYRLNIFDRRRSPGSTTCTQLPLSIYLGWICIAAVANIAAYLHSIGWNGFGISEITWACIMLALVCLITLIVIVTRKNVAFGLAIAWGVYGIVQKREVLDSRTYSPLVFTAWCCLALIILVCMLQFILNWRFKKTGPIFPEARYSLK